MKIWKPVGLGIVLAAVAVATFVPMLRTTSRSVRPVADSIAADKPPAFDRDHSAALFVGVRNFRDDAMPEVPFAVDDAIDLAYRFALDEQVSLVPAERVVLALSGEAVKPESQRRLRELRDAGARVTTANDGEILALLEQQAALAGRSGLLVVSLATHGFTRGGVPFILGATARPVSTAQMLNVIAAHDVSRSLILVDACRTRVSVGGRGVSALAVTVLSHKMPRVRGQVMISAVGEAYDDPVRRNGVFTATVLEGLDCKAALDRCCVTAQTLATFAETGTRRWIARHQNRGVGSAIQVSIDGEAKNMPLAHCCVSQLAINLTARGSIVTASKHHQDLWHRDVGSQIVSCAVVDRSAVVGTSSALIAFDEAGRRLWTTTERSPLRAFATGDLFHKHRSQIVALWGSRLSIYRADGRLESACDGERRLDHVAVCRATNHHATRLVVTSGNRVSLIDPKKVAGGKSIWSGRLLPASETITGVNMRDADHDLKNDIEITTASGKRFYLDFKGKVIGHPNGLEFELERRGRKRSASLSRINTRCSPRCYWPPAFRPLCNAARASPRKAARDSRSTGGRMTSSPPRCVPRARR